MIRAGWLLMVLLVAGCAQPPAPTTLLSYQGQEGGLQLLITPADAQVFVDAEFYGVASDFTGSKVLWLKRGLHAVEIRRDGFLTFFRQVQVSLGLVEIFVYSLQVDTD